MRPSRSVLMLAVVASAVGSLVLAQQASTPAANTATTATTSVAASPGQLIERGRYLAAAGDCASCHTLAGGTPYSGGRALPTPFGTVLSANITPDKTGIGDWTADQFYRAMHEGVDDDGKHLYPAFPYNYYTRITREDSDAIYAYLRTVPPVNNHPDRNQLSFPFNIRALMAVWNAFFLDKGPYRPDASKSAEWNRGAYLVEGLGHCGACHTPGNFAGAPKKDSLFQGGRLGDWFAPDLTSNRRTGLGAWGREEVVEYLKTGRNAHSAASAEMGEVVALSTSHLSDADLQAMATYLAGAAPSPEQRGDAPDAAVLRQGEAIWRDSCAGCHAAQGQGQPRFFPPMVGNPNVQQTDATTTLRFILEGTRAAATERTPTPLAMPAYDWKLDDAQIAAVATYARNSWGNAAGAVTARQVADLRAHLSKRATPVPGATPPTMRKPGPATLAPPDTDSRDNGGARAGTAVAAGAALLPTPASAASSPAGSSGASGPGTPAPSGGSTGTPGSGQGGPSGSGPG